MRTLGVKNDFTRGGNIRSTLDTKSRRRTILNGFENNSFEGDDSSDLDMKHDQNQMMNSETNGREMQMQNFNESIYSIGPSGRAIGFNGRDRSNFSQM